MSVSSARGGVGAATRTGRRDWLGATFWDSPMRAIQTALGVIWLIDGGLQFQHYMYTGAFIGSIKATALGQPGWVHDSMVWGANIAAHDLGLWNTLFASIQVLIGLGLLFRPTVRAALVLNLAWGLFVWWFGEGFGMMLMPDMAQPLTGAPGCITYVLVGLIAWPGRGPAGLLSRQGARTMWAALWLVMAWLWLEAGSAAPNAVHDMINAAPSGMSWLSSLQNGAAAVAKGNGVVISLVLAAASAAIGLAVAFGWRARRFLWLAIVLAVVYWIVGQGFGGIFEGGATDLNTAPLFILLALGLLALEAEPDADPGRPRAADLRPTTSV